MEGSPVRSLYIFDTAYRIQVTDYSVLRLYKKRGFIYVLHLPESLISS
ncbi:hypothetical protein [[Scytonema hofmanni] UTEX B 1581]|nr:hypothetical protein [[Scytonema hofmanni] UTEX B 1581]